MVLGSALGSIFGIVYALMFPAIMYNPSLLSLASLVSGIGRIVDTVGFVVAVLGVVQAFRFAESQPAPPQPPSLDVPAATVGTPRVVRPLRSPWARVVLLGLVIFIVGSSLTFAAQLVPFVLLSIEGIRAEYLTFAVAGVTSAVGTFLILYGIAAFLVRHT